MSSLQRDLMGTAAPCCTDKAIRRRQPVARVLIREKLTDFRRVAMTDNSNSNSWWLGKKNLVSRE